MLCAAYAEHRLHLEQVHSTPHPLNSWGPPPQVPLSYFSLTGTHFPHILHHSVTIYSFVLHIRRSQWRFQKSLWCSYHGSLWFIRCCHLVASSGVVNRGFHPGLSFELSKGVVIWGCHPRMCQPRFSSRVVIWVVKQGCFLRMSSEDVIWGCHLRMSSEDVIRGCHPRMSSEDVISGCH
jgi:hypothetical protein